MSEENLNAAEGQPAVEEAAEIKTDTAAAPAEAPSWVPRRISEITAARRAAEAQVAQEREGRMRAEQELAALKAHQQGDPATGYTAPAVTPDSIERLAQARAETIARQQVEQQTLGKRVADIEAAGMKEFGTDFTKSVENLSMLGVGGQDFLHVLTSIPNPEKVVTYLGQDANLDEALRIASLSPVQMAIEMTALAGKAAKALAKPVSKTPPPPVGIEGGSSGREGREPDVGTDPAAWIAWRNKNARKNRR